MEQNVFTYEKELGRLSTQNELIYSCEYPVFREIFAGKNGLRVLDVGCNDGEKTFRWFSVPAVSRVIGLELDEKLVEHAQKSYGGKIFSFRSCDVNTEDFPAQLKEILRREDVLSFDIIYVSLLLSHLRKPEALLRQLRPLLREGGILVAVESDDANAFLTPEDRRFREFLDMLSQDPYAGDRSVGGRLDAMLSGCGYRSPVLHRVAISAGPGEEEKKEMIFEMFFTFLPEDVRLLRATAPKDARYVLWERWLQENYAALRRAICAPGSRISIGISVITWSGNTERV
ncbi:MAG: class I SAM-dependent methyltransferase [Oscillospiraceae bacterium]|nr:class I SAM-dependent methyltransferase [Oscillospiraceae bacterium]